MLLPCPGKAVFDAIRERVGFKAALGALVSSEVVDLMTLACEIGGGSRSC